LVSQASAATYVYDDLGRLTSVTYDNGQKIAYTYDSAGNRLTTTVIAPDTIAPTITGTDPVNGTTQVTVDKTVYVTFSKNVYPGVSFNSITLKAGTTVVAAIYTINGNVLSIDPVDNLSNDLTYTVTIPAGSVRDNAGNALSSNYTFSFSTPDTIPPTIISTNPINGAVNVSKYTKSIVLEFNENIQSDDLRYVVFKAEGVIYPAAIGYDASSRKVISGNRLIIYPKSPMFSNKNYYVSIPNSCLKDMAGNYFDAPTNPVLTFTTGP